MKEIADAYPDGNAVLALNDAELDAFILECVRRRAAGNGLALPKYLSRGELENIYGVTLSLPAASVIEINHKLAAAYQRLLSGNLLMPAPGQPAEVVTAAPEAAGGSETANVSMREWAGDDRVPLTIVYTDIVGSALMGRELGDARMNEIRRQHFARSDELVRKSRGRRVKTLGDGVLAVFRSVGAALNFASTIQVDPGAPELKVRIGIHAGEVDVTEDDISGSEADFASRVVNAIVGPEIWLSTRAKEHLDGAGAHPEKTRRWQPCDVALKSFGTARLWRLGDAADAALAPAEPVAWWSIAEAAAWIREQHPGATGGQVCATLEQLVREGRIKARGRRRVYSTDRPLRIAVVDPEFVWFAERSGPPQPWPESIGAGLWADLAIFVRPKQATGEQYPDAVMHALDELANAAELRSKSRYRLEWADPEFSSEDVRREWPKRRDAT
jgi:class 3 adenylate cyclase